MALSYEEALSTLESMFSNSSDSSSAWTRETLDAVLRHQKGHMENTVDFILRHSGKDPQMLTEQLKAGVNPDESAVNVDAELARQLGNVGVSSSGSSGFGAPTTLPDDFLRIPGYTPSSESDEALARRLQQEENRQSRAERTTASQRAARARQPAATAPAPAAVGPNLQQNLQTVQNQLGKLGENVSSQFRMFASRFNKNIPPPEPQAAAPSSAERRGLLDMNDDDDDVELEFARR